MELPVSTFAREASNPPVRVVRTFAGVHRSACQSGNFCMPSNVDNFRLHLSTFFIETGSYLGDGIQQALDAGFKHVISIELSPKYHAICRERFKAAPNVHLFQGESFQVLPKILATLKQRATFWLDGHHSGGDTALGAHWAPLMQELDAIENHPIHDHIILIDDMRCWKTFNPAHGFVTDDIFDKHRSINPEYAYSYLDGHEKDDILVARVPVS